MADRIVVSQAPPATVDTPTGGRWWRPLWTVRVLQVALWALVATAPVIAAMALAEAASLRGHIATVAAAAAPAPVDLSEPEGLAVLAVDDHLTAAGWAPAGITSLGTEETGPDVVIVTVAARIQPTLDDEEAAEPRSVGRLFFAVAMVRIEGAWGVAGLPALIAGPEPSVATDRARRDRLDAVPGLEAAVSGFLAAYLIGDGDVERYTAPDAHIHPVVPPPFTSIEITDAGSLPTGDRSLEVLVLVEGVDATGVALAVAYSLVVTERDGRFEVAHAGAPVPAIPRVERGGSS